jgi:hypothetical protein
VAAVPQAATASPGAVTAAMIERRFMGGLSVVSGR